MSDAVCPAVLNGLPNRLLSVALTGVNRDVEILALNEMKGFDVLLGGIPAFFTGKIEADDSTLAKIDGEFRHFQRHVHIAHRADNQSCRHSKVLSTAVQSLQHR